MYGESKQWSQNGAKLSSRRYVHFKTDREYGFDYGMHCGVSTGLPHTPSLSAVQRAFVSSQFQCPRYSLEYTHRKLVEDSSYNPERKAGNET